MIIVIEGPDGTGKTTLARELERRGWRYMHNGTPPTGCTLYEHYERQILGCQGQNVVFDRLHVGELVYGPVMRGRSLITVEEMRILNRLIFTQGARLISCDTDDEVVEYNWARRREKEYVDNVDKLWEIISRYRTLVDQEFFSSTRWRFDYQVNNIKTFLDQRLQFQLDACPDGVWGSPQNQFLIVGERPAGGYDRAFCAMSNSSGFLNECLWEADYPEHLLAFTNARMLDGKARDLRKLWYEQPKQVVITLGQVAENDCTHQGVPHLALKHPQFVKRFLKSSNRGQYVRLLRQVREGK